MDLNNILLNHDQLEELYKSGLTAIDHTPVLQPAIPSPTSKTEFSVKGKFKKKFLWLIYNEQHPFLDDSDFQFLTQVLEACKMNWDDIALLNCYGLSASVTNITETLQPSFVLASGLPGTFLSKKDAYQVSQQTDFAFFSTDALSEIRTDKTLKTKLWNGLKQLLQI